jgi:hypothetical protein
MIVSGRFIAENPYRELNLKNILEKRGFEVCFVIPSRTINAQGYPESMRRDRVFQMSQVRWLEKKMDFWRWLGECDAVLFGSWKSYESLAAIAGLAGKPTVTVNTTSGLDFWPLDADLICVRSDFDKRRLMHFQRNPPGHRRLTEERIVVTGSLIHEPFETAKGVGENQLDRERFCRVYRLDPSVPIVVLFPKGIGSFNQKVPRWFPAWSENQCDRYNSWFLSKYIEICRGVKDGRCNLVIKMHPSAYASYLCSAEEEYKFWSQISWAKVLAPEHTYDCYRHADYGVGITSHSALDLGFFGKPFIYVDSDQIEYPKAFPNFPRICRLPPGPSVEWDRCGKKIDYHWFPSWLGGFSRAKDLADVLNSDLASKITNKQKEMFIEEFWYRRDGNSAVRMVECAIDHFQSNGGRRRVTKVFGQIGRQCKKHPRESYRLFR